MFRFNDLKIATKLAAVILFLGAVVLFVGLWSARLIDQVDAGYGKLVHASLPANTDISRANRRAIEQVYTASRAIAFDPQSEEARKLPEALAKGFGRGNKNFDEAVETDPSLKDAVAKLKDRYAEVHRQSAAAIELSLAGRRDEARAMVLSADRELEALAEAISELTYARVDASDAATAALEQQVTQTKRSMLIISLLAMIVGGGLAMIAARGSIARPLERLKTAMRALADGNHGIDLPDDDRRDEIGQMASAVAIFRETAIVKEAAEVAARKIEAEQQQIVTVLSRQLERVARGDLTADIADTFPDSHARLRADFNDALASLRTLIGTVIERSHAIQTGSSEIAQASDDLARRTEANAASLEETSAAITQMNERLRQTADAAARTVDRADGTMTVVASGRTVADDATQAMIRVADSAKGIDDVIEGLDKIAFQTRVLAMNAAVEAGRAGEAGRGFAVVADLVSALAMRAEEEAGRAREQLTVTRTDIGSAVGAVQKVDGALANIASDVAEVHALLGHIAADNQAQSVAVTQISSAIQAMDQSTQQNAAMVEQTSAAARSLSSEVTTLTEQSARFTISSEKLARAVIPPAVAARAASAAPKAAAPAKAADKPKRAAKPKPQPAAPAYRSPVKALPRTNGSAAVATDGDSWDAF